MIFGDAIKRKKRYVVLVNGVADPDVYVGSAARDHVRMLDSFFKGQKLIEVLEVKKGEEIKYEFFRGTRIYN